MKKIDLAIEVITPVIMSETVGGNNHISTADSISGSSILGSVAARYLQSVALEHAEADDQFRRLFLSDNVIYRNANLEINGKRSIPVPRNIVQKKSDKELFIDVFDDHSKELIDTSHRAGFTSGSLIQRPGKQIHFHSSRKQNRLGGKSVDGDVYTYAGLAGNQTFRGEILGKEEDLKVIESLFIEDPTIRFGRSKTAQYGECRMNMGSIETVDISPVSNSLTMALLSPLIITNKYGAPSTLLPDMVDYFRDNYQIKMSVKQAMIRTNIVETYNRKWGTKRPADSAFAPGSVFKLELESAKAVDRFKTLLVNGVGLRRNEGYGEISVVNFDVSEFSTPENKVAPIKPAGMPDKAVQDLFKKIIQKECFIHAEHLGLKYSIEPQMPNSLTTRLLDLFRGAEHASEISEFLTSIQTEKGVDKRAAEHLKRVYLNNGQKLFDIFKKAQSEIDNFSLTPMQVKDGFLNSFPSKVGVDLEQFKTRAWLHYWKTILTRHVKETSI